MLPIPMKISFWTVVLWNIMQFPMDISVLDKKPGNTGNWCSPVKYTDLHRCGRIWKEYMSEVLKLPIFWCVSGPARTGEGFETIGTTRPHWQFSDPMDLRISHDRVGSSTDPTLNWHLKYPNNLDQSLNDAAVDKIRKYRADYNNTPPSVVSVMPPSEVSFIPKTLHHHAFYC